MAVLSPPRFLQTCYSTIDIFGSPKMFANMKEKLLKSYALDAIGVANKKAAPPKPHDILDFYRTTLRQRANTLKEYKDNRNMKKESPRAISNESLNLEGELIHRSLLKK